LRCAEAMCRNGRQKYPDQYGQDTPPAPMLSKARHRLDFSAEGYGFMSRSLPLSVELRKENLFEALIMRRSIASGDENIRVRFAEKLLHDILLGGLKEVVE
jgi:hypothetical protein